jgi:hypothetical protein
MVYPICGICKEENTTGYFIEYKKTMVCLPCGDNRKDEQRSIEKYWNKTNPLPHHIVPYGRSKD